MGSIPAVTVDCSDFLGTALTSKRVFSLLLNQHGREKAEDKGEHQSKANPIVLHKDLDTDGALSSQDRWPAWIVDHYTGGPNCPEVTKAALTNPDGRQFQAPGTFGKSLFPSRPQEGEK